MVGLMRSAAVVLTDSGGVQEETTALGVPCLTMRSNTERPITVDEGTNTLVGTMPQPHLAGRRRCYSRWRQARTCSRMLGWQDGASHCAAHGPLAFASRKRECAAMIPLMSSAPQFGAIYERADN